MNSISYTKTIKKNWEIVALITGIAVAATLVAALIQPFKYRATSKILIIQNQDVNLDAYTATKSAEKIGKNLTEVVSSTIFYDAVIKANPRLATEFPSDEMKRRKAWQKDVEANMVPETGILELGAYHQDKAMAAELAQTVSLVLLNKGSEFHGGGDNVFMKVIDDVYVGKYPVRPNLILNLAFAIVLGFVTGALFVIMNEARVLNTRYQQKTIFDLETENPVIHDVEKTREIRGLSLQPYASEMEPLMARNWRIIED